MIYFIVSMPLNEHTMYIIMFEKLRAGLGISFFLLVHDVVLPETQFCDKRSANNVFPS